MFRERSVVAPSATYRFAAVLIGALCAIGAAPRAPVGGTIAAIAQQQYRAIPAGVDGVIVRGRWRAKIALGAPRFRYVANASDWHEVVLSHTATTLTIVQTGAPAREPVSELNLSVPHLRGVAVSGAVDLVLDDRSDAPLFLDLSGTGTVRATGTVPLLRVTTSGSVTADLTALAVKVARVHARQHSRLAIRAHDSLTIVALDSAHVSYSAKRVYLNARGSSLLTRF